MGKNKMIFEKAQALKKEQKSFVMVTMVEAIGSAPQVAGAKCLVSLDGLEAGTVGGGKVEARAIEKAKEILKGETKKNAPVLVEWNLQKDIGMTCGGVGKFLFEHFPASPWNIAIFGAGHVSQALSRVLSKLECQVHVIDDREEWASKLEGVKVHKTSDAKEAVSLFNENTFFISMTKGHAFDVPFLVEVFRQFPNAPYIGAIGSKSKANAIKKDLDQLGVGQDFLDRLRIPLGLPLGNNTPEEISISITAQLLQVRDGLN